MRRITLFLNLLLLMGCCGEEVEERSGLGMGKSPTTSGAGSEEKGASASERGAAERSGSDAVVQRFPAPRQAAAVFSKYSAYPLEDVVAEVIRWNNESALCVKAFNPRWKNHTIRFKKSFFSEDSEHGWYVISVVWSPNGRYLAYQLSNSGGHQPYRSPVHVIDIQTAKVHVVGDYVRKTPGISNIAVTYRGEGCLYWSKDGLLHFQVWDHEDKGSGGEWVFDPITGKVEQTKNQGEQRRTNKGGE